MASAVIDPAVPVTEMLARYGPATQRAATLEESQRYVRGLAAGHYENFSVLSSLVPEDLRDDFAAVYAFCRWADDLGDETGNDEAARQRSIELLAWWRRETVACFERSAAAGGPTQPPAPPPTHPVMVALRRTVERGGGGGGRAPLPVQPFLDLIDAFEQDQRVTRYQTWDQVIDYCRRSANPVGRIVLHLGGYPNVPENAQRYAMSDSTCTALQLTNFWQDVRRDLVERDRVYLPSEESGVTGEMLKEWMSRSDDPAARVPYMKAVRTMVERTWPLFEHGARLPETLSRRIRPVVWLFGAGGRAVLRRVERIGCATLWERPRLGKMTKAGLVGRAWLAAKLGRNEF